MANFKLIFSPQLARFLCKKGFKICDLKAHRETGETIFVFEANEELFKSLEEFKTLAN